MKFIMRTSGGRGGVRNGNNNIIPTGILFKSVPNIGMRESGVKSGQMGLSFITPCDSYTKSRPFADSHHII